MSRLSRIGRDSRGSGAERIGIPKGHNAPPEIDGGLDGINLGA